MYRKEKVGSPNGNIGLDDSYVQWSFDPFNGDLTQSYPRQIDSQNIVNFKAIAEETPFIDISTTPKEIRGSSYGFYHFWQYFFLKEIYWLGRIFVLVLYIIFHHLSLSLPLHKREGHVSGFIRNLL